MNEPTEDLGEGRVHFSDPNEPWQISRHADVLDALNNVEQKLVAVLRAAATAIEYATPPKSTEDNAAASFKTSSSEFLQLVKDIHTELASHIHKVSNYSMYGRSAYGVQKDLDLSREKVKVIAVQLQSLTRYLEENAVMEEN